MRQTPTNNPWDGTGQWMRYRSITSTPSARRLASKAAAALPCSPLRSLVVMKISSRGIPQAAIAACGIPREEIFITTKLRNGEQGNAAAAFEASRRALGVDVIDLYLIHWPVPSQGLFVGVWRILEKIYAADGVRAIGVSNFLQEHLDTLLAETTIVPAVNQFELHPTFQQAALSAKTRAHGIAVEAYSPLGRGSDLSAEAVTTLAQKHGVTPAQIVLGWHLGVGNIVIPKSVSSHRLRENLAASELTLTQDELDAITALESGVRIAPDPAEAAFTQM